MLVLTASSIGSNRIRIKLSTSSGRLRSASVSPFIDSPACSSSKMIFFLKPKRKAANQAMSPMNRASRPHTEQSVHVGRSSGGRAWVMRRSEGEREIGSVLTIRSLDRNPERKESGERTETRNRERRETGYIETKRERGKQ